MMDETEKIIDSNLSQKTQKKEKLFVQQVQNLDFGCDIFCQKITAWSISQVSARAEV